MDILWIKNIIAVFFLCIILAGVLIPQILLIAYRRKLFDEPNVRKVHTMPVPRLGGMAFSLVIFFSIAFVFGINAITGHIEILKGIQSDIPILAFGFCAVMLLYIVGIADDLIGVRYIAKFIVQIIGGVLLIAGGLYSSNLYGLAWVHEMPKLVAYPFTILVIVFIINAVNLIDGIDGLASGLCSVAFITYAITFLKTEEYMFAVIAFANLGALLPFFYYNVFGSAEKQSKIFMGDTGSLTIGILICLLSLKVLECVPVESAEYPNPFVIAFSPLIIPCFDVIRVYMRRVRDGRNPFLPDKNHIHHKLLAIGMKQRPTMIFINFLSLMLVFVNCTTSMYIDINILLIADAAFITFGNIWLTKVINSKTSK